MGPLTPLPRAWIERLFSRFADMYGSRFADMYACVKAEELERVKATWAEELAGFTGDEIGRGIDACRQRDWPPSLPEFRRFCRPGPAYEAAFYEAVEQLRRRDEGKDAWSHPAIYWAAVSMTYDLMAQSYSQVRGRWCPALDRALARVEAGELPASVPPARPALPAPGQASPDKTRVRRHLDDCWAAIGKGRGNGGT